jgi:DNA-binding beta-propeller fold protein YncE
MLQVTIYITILLLSGCQFWQHESPANVKENSLTFSGPFGIAVKGNGSFYVAQIEGKRISKFDAQGNFCGNITSISGYGDLRGPFDVFAAPSGNLYIADTLGHCILILDPAEKLVLKLGKGKASAEPGEFQQPHFVYADETLGHIYVSDTLNNRVQLFDLTGKLLKIIRCEPARTGLRSYTVGISCDSSGNLYIMDNSGSSIHVYDTQLNFIKTIGNRGSSPAQFNDAYGLTIHNDTIWVADTYNNRIQHLSLKGNPLSVFGGEEGSDIHHFSHPADIGVDANDNLYVTDWKNARVIKLDANGHFLRQWGNPNTVADYLPPKIYPHNPCRGPITIATYSGINKESVDKAAQAGVDWIYVSFDNQSDNWNIKSQVDYAHVKGIKVAPSIAIYPLGSGLSRWQEHPECFMWKKGESVPDTSALSYFSPEVRQWRAKHIAEQVKESGVDGVLLDYIRYPDTICGYEPTMKEAFKHDTGKDADILAPDDLDWLNFRARFITLFIEELRYELSQLDNPVELSVYVGPDWKSDLQTVIRSWRDWVNMGIVDKICLGIYSRDFKSFYEGIRQARATCPDRTKIDIMIACWGGNLNTPELLKKGAEVSLAAGVDEIAIYRGDAIDQLKLWNTIGEISMHKNSR